jgi:uncharacterized membrane protein YqhA
MKKLLESSTRLILIVVVTALIAAVAALAWGVYQAGDTIVHLLKDFNDPLIAVSFIEIMDAFLIAIGLYIFALVVYELFIGDLDLPAWLQIHTLYELKVKLVSVIVLVMGVKFLEKFAESKSAEDTLMIGIAFAVAAAALVGFSAVIKGE